MLMRADQTACSKCGDAAEFGYKIQGGPAMEWFCAEHRLSQNYADERLPKAVAPPSASEPLDKAQQALADHANAIRILGKRAIADVIEIGRHLTEAKNLCGHGHWLPWLRCQFGWTEQTALNYMRLHERQADLKRVLDLDLPLRSLYLIAAPNTPPEACQEIVERFESGELVSVEQVRDTIDKARFANIRKPHAKAKKPPSSIPDPPPAVQHKQIAAGLTHARGMSLATLDQFIIELRQLRREKKRG
jgi:hypothetical protein